MADDDETSENGSDVSGFGIVGQAGDVTKRAASKAADVATGTAKAAASGTKAAATTVGKATTKGAKAVGDKVKDIDVGDVFDVVTDIIDIVD